MLNSRTYTDQVQVLSYIKYQVQVLSYIKDQVQVLSYIKYSLLPYQ